MAFRSRDTVALIRERLEALAGRSLESLFEGSLHHSPDTRQTLKLLEAMLEASPDPQKVLCALDEQPELAATFCNLSGAHSAIASALARDPGVSLRLLDSRWRSEALEPDRLFQDGMRFLDEAHGEAHLRPFKLERLAAVILSGRTGEWPAERQQQALEHLAEALAAILATRIWDDRGSCHPPLQPGIAFEAADREQVRSFYEHLVEALRRLEDRHHPQEPHDNGRILDSILGAVRRRIQGLPASLLGLEARHPDARAEVLRRLGTHGSVAAHWLDSYPEPNGLYELLLEQDRAFVRFQTILREGPSLIPALMESLPLTQSILTEDLEADYHPDSLVRELPPSCNLHLLAEEFTAGWVGACARWLLEPSFDLGAILSDLMDALLVHCAHRLYIDFDLIALGSYGRRELAPGSDADVLFLVQDPRLREQTNQQAADLLALTSKLARLGAPVRLDVRIERDGSDFTVRTYDDFLTYELEEMQMWQRFELGMARGILGSEEAVAVATKAAYAQPLTPERLQELLERKKRVETERLRPQHRQRDIKLGEGALGDLEWFVHIMEMRYPTATRAGEQVLMEDRIRALGRARLINAIEVHELQMARTHLLELRNRLELMGVQEDVLPENPAKLEALAVRLFATDANDLLLRHERLTKTVRTIYMEATEALKVW